MVSQQQQQAFKRRRLVAASSSASSPEVEVAAQASSSEVEVAAQLLSYKCAEEALERACGVADLKAEPLMNRGALERSLTDAQRTEVSRGSMVTQFLCALAIVSSTAPRRLSGSSVASRLASAHLGGGDLLRSLTGSTFYPPRRSLIGSVHCCRSGVDYEVALQLDRADPESRFTILLGKLEDEGRRSSEKSKAKTTARLLAEVDTATGDLAVRGIHVAEDQRGTGVSKVLLSVFASLCLACFGRPPISRPINKPLIAKTLQSMGYEPVDTRWPVYIWPDHASSSVNLRPKDPDDRRHHFSNAVKNAQRIVVTDIDPPPEGASLIYLKTAFSHPDPDTLRQVIAQNTAETTFFSARLIAILSTVTTLRPQLYHDLHQSSSNSPE